MVKCISFALFSSEGLLLLSDFSLFWYPSKSFTKFWPGKGLPRIGPHLLFINLIYLRTPLELYKLHPENFLALFKSSSEEGTNNIKHFFHHHSILELYSERKRSNLSKDLLWAESKLNRTEDSISAFREICCFEDSLNSKCSTLTKQSNYRTKISSDRVKPHPKSWSPTPEEFQYNAKASYYVIVVSAIILLQQKGVLPLYYW